MARFTIIPIPREAAMTFRDLYLKCSQQLRAWGYSDETRDVYERVWVQYLAFVKGRGAHDDVRSFNDRLVMEYAEWMGRPTETRPAIHPNTIIKCLSALSSLAKYGMMARDDKDRPLLQRDPTKSFRWPRGQRRETKFLYPDDLRRLIDAPAPTYKALARDVLIETGIRVGEAVRLNVENFHDANGRYYLSVKVKGRGQQRRQETRDVPLSKGTGDALRNWLLLRGNLQTKPDSPLLIDSEDDRWSRANLSNMISRLAVAAGIRRLRVSAHKLRHTANVIGRLAKVDRETRSQMFGHSSLRSLERYDHVFPYELHEAREAQLDELQRYIGRPNRRTPEGGDEARNEPGENANTDAGRDD